MLLLMNMFKVMFRMMNVGVSVIVWNIYDSGVLISRLVVLDKL